MLRLLSSPDLWTWLQGQATKSTRRVAAIAYVTRDDLIRFGEGDLLLADASEGAIGSGQTSAAVLRKAFTRGAEIGSVQGLHAKVLCLDHHVVVGSANVSNSSLEELIEAAVVSDDPLLLGSTLSFIRRLQKQAVLVDEKFLARIEAIPVKRSWQPGRAKDRPSVPSPRTWLVGITAFDDSRYEHETVLAEEGKEKVEERLSEPVDISWIRITGSSRFRREAQESDLVIQIWRSKKKSKRIYVYPRVPILRRQDEPACTRFYVPEPEHAEGRALPWAEFAKVWGRSEGGLPPGRDTARLLSPELAERLVSGWPWR